MVHSCIDRRNSTLVYPPITQKDYAHVLEGTSVDQEGSIEEAFSKAEIELHKASFDQQFHYGVFYSYFALKEREIRNLTLIAEVCMGVDHPPQSAVIFFHTHTRTLSLPTHNSPTVHRPGAAWKNPQLLPHLLEEIVPLFLARLSHTGPLVKPPDPRKKKNSPHLPMLCLCSGEQRARRPFLSLVQGHQRTVLLIPRATSPLCQRSERRECAARDAHQGTVCHDQTVAS